MGLFDIFNKKEHATIQVTFINNADNSMIGVAELSIDRSSPISMELGCSCSR